VTGTHQKGGIMIRGKSRIVAYALLAFLAGFSAFAAQEKPKNLKPSDYQALLKKANITRVVHFGLGEPLPTMYLEGTNFGTTQGTKCVRVDGTLASQCYWWSDTSVAFKPPSPLIYWDHVYQFAIVDGPLVLSNIFSTRIPWDFDHMTPKQGEAGTEVSIYVYQLPDSPGGLVLKIGTFNFPVVGWTPHDSTFYYVGIIKAKVPAGTPVGLQNVYLQKGGQVASEVSQFKVLLPYAPPLGKIIK
jgi:hypothetical protein